LIHGDTQLNGNRVAAPLEGRGIVITRPAEQAAELAQRVLELGGRPIVFPTIEILDVDDSTLLDAIIDRLDTFDAAIFISPNAAARGMRAIRSRRELPPRLEMIAIGRGSADALRREGVHSVSVPRERFDSEALLELPQLRAAQGRRFVIFRGQDGRALLGDTLERRGAIVEYATCYRRVKACPDITPLVQSWSRRELDAFVVTSSESLRHLHELVGRGRESYLNATPLFVPHPRIESTARDLGLSSIFVTEAGDAGIARTLAKHFGA
jgi:uroporphyrinogen-III synthase